MSDFKLTPGSSDSSVESAISSSLNLADLLAFESLPSDVRMTTYLVIQEKLKDTYNEGYSDGHVAGVDEGKALGIQLGREQARMHADTGSLLIELERLKHENTRLRVKLENIRQASL